VNTFARSLASLCAAVLVCVGVLLLVTAPAAHELAPSQARAVVGGTNNLDYTTLPCPNTVFCNTLACPGGQGTCPVGPVQTLQNMPNYPNGTKAGTTYNNTTPLNYTCDTIPGVCGNPCTQIPMTNNWVCGGPFGGARAPIVFVGVDGHTVNEG
jgi:hypothetical protein